MTREEWTAKMAESERQQDAALREINARITPATTGAELDALQEEKLAAVRNTWAWLAELPAATTVNYADLPSLPTRVQSATVGR